MSIKNTSFFLLYSLTFLSVGCSSHHSNTKKPNTYIDHKDGKYRLYKAGKPYTIKGAGGYTNIESLKEAGGNTIRIWDTANLATVLQKAKENNIAVIVGLPIYESEYLFYYNDPSKVAKQYQSIKAFVNRYKTDPSILMWCVGNELYFPYSLSYRNFYKAFNHIVDMIHEDDPDHPVTTTMVNFQPSQIFNLKFRTDVDIISFNIFGRLSYLKRDLKRFSWLWNGPYMITEWGNNGPWGDEPQTAWSAYIEPSSTQKAAQYFTRYKESMPIEDSRLLGSFIFYWGQKQETTHTWFSMFDEYGNKTEAVSIAKYIWTGKINKNGPPKISSILIDHKDASANIIFQPADTAHAEIILLQPDTAITSIKWEIYPEDWNKKNGKSNTIRPEALSGRIFNSKGLRTDLIAPVKEGPYRLFAVIYDQYGNIANCNIPFYVIPNKQ